ncbi:hypothetical protein [Natrinema sp. SYSU A 869]|uniref:hypothetical protein n=1 Tax=Natrinema sp. SYSU A 869 TaxID=2871694 RepID=UPI0031F2E5F1
MLRLVVLEQQRDLLAPEQQDRRQQEPPDDRDRARERSEAGDSGNTRQCERQDRHQ